MVGAPTNPTAVAFPVTNPTGESGGEKWVPLKVSTDNDRVENAKSKVFYSS